MSGSMTCGRGSPAPGSPSRPHRNTGGPASTPAYLRSLVAYWAGEFDWRAAETRLNAYPQFIERGQHFVHIRRDPTRPPVLLTHGWPSTFLELLPLADLLDVDVVIPSLPGYLYSDLLDVPATRKNIGESFHVLMYEILGYDRYFAFGGDVGGSACGWLATMHPDEVAGLHVIHGPFPAEYAEPITAAEQVWLDSEDERDETRRRLQRDPGDAPRHDRGGRDRFTGRHGRVHHRQAPGLGGLRWRSRVALRPRHVCASC